MATGHNCSNCGGGCTERHTPSQINEEIKAGPYLVAAGVLVILISIALKYLF
ncbi:MAG: hypothetical protein AB7V04_03635 [Desulfomonilaceae bacterium]|jgi:hypothetical protein|nr:hypothetical protein [Syntrophaceae bacterium]